MSRARQDTEVIPIRSVSSVQATKKGLRTNVCVFTTGNTIDFRVSHDEGQQLKDLLMGLVLEKDTPASAPVSASAPVEVAEEIRRLGELRDQGQLTEDEFTQRKAKILDS